MVNITEALREEHKELLPRIDELRHLADSLDETDGDEIRRGLEPLYQFLVRNLIPHARAEEQALYPAVARILGSSQATATMSRDHLEVIRLTEQIGLMGLEEAPLKSDNIRNLRRLLYGLHTLLKVHFAKEEEIYLPLLESHLSDSEAHRLLHKMAHTAHGEHH